MRKIIEAKTGDTIYISDLMTQVEFKNNEPVKIRIDEAVIYYTDPKNNRVYHVDESELHDFIQKNPSTKINYSIRK